MVEWAVNVIDKTSVAAVVLYGVACVFFFCRAAVAVSAIVADVAA